MKQEIGGFFYSERYGKWEITDIDGEKYVTKKIENGSEKYTGWNIGDTFRGWDYYSQEISEYKYIPRIIKKLKVSDLL